MNVNESYPTEKLSSIDHLETISSPRKARMRMSSESDLPKEIVESSDDAKEIHILKLEETSSSEDLAVFFKNTIANMRRHLNEMIAAESSMPRIQEFITDIYSTIVGTAAEMAENKLLEEGIECPCDYAFLGLGSLARGETSPYSDLDFACLIEKDTPENRAYFKKFITIMFEFVKDLGESEKSHRGISFCLGELNPPYLDHGIDVGSPQMLNPPKELAKHAKKSEEAFKDKEKYYPVGADPKQISNALQQVGLMAGSQKLLSKFLQEKAIIYQAPLPEEEAKAIFPNDSTKVRRQRKYCHQRGLEMMRYGKTSLGVEEISDSQATVDIKKSLLRPIQAAIIGLTIYYGIDEPNIIKAIDKLVEAKQMNPILGNRLKEAYEFGSRLRLKTQLQTKSESDKVALGESEGRHYQLTDEERITLLKTKTLLFNFSQLYQKFLDSNGTINAFAK
jgi:hypothetical protein